MTFLNPLLLFGLAAASIPIIIHLLNLRKLRTVEFSTLQFLKELQRTKMRRVKIRQWLLLALRTLLIIAVVMAFSRPALRGSLAGFGGATTAKTTMVLLLDDSPSMSVRNERGELFARAKDAAARILDLMKEGDDAYLVKLSDIRRTPVFHSARTAAPLRSALDQLTPTQESIPFRDALGVAAKLLGESKNFNREVYLITDAQASRFAPESGAADTVDLFDDNVKFFLADVRSGSTARAANAGVTSAAVTSAIITRNKPVTMQASIRNAGEVPLRNSLMSLYLDGARVLQHSLDIGSNSVATPNLTVTPKRRGILKGYVQLEDDAFEADNRRFFIVNVPHTVRVLAAGASDADTRFPSLALTLDQDSADAGLFSVTRINEAQLSSHDLNMYDMLILCGLRDLTTGEADRIARFVAAGGGLVLFAGNDMDLANFNQLLFARLGIPPVGGVTSLGNGGDHASGFLSFGRIDFEHPLFAGLFEKKTGTAIESPRVTKTLTPQPGTRGRSIISLADGTHFLTEYRHGAGRVLLFSIDGGLAWSDFPLKGAFVPLLYRSGLYVAHSEPAAAFTVGDEVALDVRLRTRTDKDVFVLRSPSGIDERVVPQFSAATGLATFRSSNVTEAGIYELRNTSGGAGELLRAIPVNIAPEETDLTPADDDLVRASLARVGVSEERVTRLDVAENIDTAILESRFGVELWKYFIGLALLLAMIEMAIGREAKEQKA